MEVVTTKTESYYKSCGVLKYNEVTAEDINEIPVPAIIREKIAENAAEYINEGYDAYNNYIVSTTSSIIFSAIVYITLFILIYIILGIVFLVLNVVSKLPVLSQINELAGFFLGLLFGIMIIWVLFFVVTIFSNYAFMSRIITDIGNNAVLSFLYDNDPLLKIMLIFV